MNIVYITFAGYFGILIDLQCLWNTLNDHSIMHLVACTGYGSIIGGTQLFLVNKTPEKL